MNKKPQNNSCLEKRTKRQDNYNHASILPNQSKV